MCTICFTQLCNIILVNNTEHEHLVHYGHGSLKFNTSIYTQICYKKRDNKTFKHKIRILWRKYNTNSLSRKREHLIIYFCLNGS